MTPAELFAIMQAVAAAHGQVSLKETTSASQCYQPQQSTPVTTNNVRPSALQQHNLFFETPSFGISVPASAIVVQPDVVTSAAIAVTADTRMCAQRRKTIRKPHGREAILILEAWYSDHQPQAYADRQTVKSLAATTRLSEDKVRKWMANKRRKHSETATKRNKL